LFVGRGEGGGGQGGRGHLVVQLIDVEIFQTIMPPITFLLTLESP